MPARSGRIFPRHICRASVHDRPLVLQHSAKPGAGQPTIFEVLESSGSVTVKRRRECHFMNQDGDPDGSRTNAPVRDLQSPCRSLERQSACRDASPFPLRRMRLLVATFHLDTPEGPIRGSQGHPSPTYLSTQQRHRIVDMARDSLASTIMATSPTFWPNTVASSRLPTGPTDAPVPAAGCPARALRRAARLATPMAGQAC